MFVIWSILLVCLTICVNAEILGHSPTCGAPGRLTAANQTALLGYHNQYRDMNAATNGIADSVKLVWCKQLSNFAQKTADSCLFQHSWYHSCRSLRMGQNLYYTADPNLSFDHVLGSWYNETNYYHQATSSCEPGQMCGHYTQVVWSPVGEVGCAANFCPLLNKSGGGTQANTWLVVCNYSPPGNMLTNGAVGHYGTVGAPCSECPRAFLTLMYNSRNLLLYITGYKCEGSLCAQCDPATTTGCHCVSAAKCYNGGVWDAATCRCTCATGPLGFWGIQCQHACTCTDVFSGWFCLRTFIMGYCNPTHKYAYQAHKRCPVTCNACVTVDQQQCLAANG